MNYIKEIVEKILPVVIGEEFNIVFENSGNYSKYNPYKFTETDLLDKDGEVCDTNLALLIKGKCRIEKIPFVPKIGEDYRTYVCFGSHITIMQYIWRNDYSDKMNKLFGLVFRTEQDAIDYLPTWEKRLEGEEV